MKHYKRVKATYDRGYVNAMDKIRVFIESNQKVMYIGTGEYASSNSATTRKPKRPTGGLSTRG